MGKVEADIKDGLEQIAKKFGPSVLVLAKVLSVNQDLKTIEVSLQNDVVIDDVRLKSVVKNENYQVVFPSINSTVLIGKIDDTEDWVMLAYDSIDKFSLNIGLRQFEFSADGLLIKNNAENLKSVLQDLIQAIQSITVTCAPAGSVSTPPVNVGAFTSISSRINNLLK